MKVAYIFQPPWDAHVHVGLGIWNYHVTRRLARDCNIIVYSAAVPGHSNIEYLEGVEYRHISLRFNQRALRYLSALRKRSLLGSPIFAYSAYYLAFAIRVANDLRRQRCDIVHIHTLSQFVPIIRALNPKIRIVLHNHGEWLTQLNRRMIAPRLEKVDLIIGCSEYVTNRIRMSFPVHAKRCHTVFMGVDPEVFYPNTARPRAVSPRRKRLLYVGRMSPEKGVHVLPEAFENVLVVHPETELEIVGPDAVMPTEYLIDLSDDPHLAALKVFYNGDYRAFIKRQLPADCARSVKFRGLVLQPELANHYREADVFVFPSFYESLGTSAIEAMATALPVVATTAGGVPEVIENGRTGILVPPGDARELAKAILRLLADDELRLSMGAAGRKRAVEIFSFEAISQRLLGLYRAINDYGRR